MVAALLLVICGRQQLLRCFRDLPFKGSAVVAKPVKKRRRGMDPGRIQAVLASLPADELQRIRRDLKNAPPPKPKKRTGRPISRRIEGERFGRWQVGPRADKPGRVFHWCLCDCGNVAAVDKTNLVRGHSRQCRNCAGKDVAKNLSRRWRRRS
jgi:hypothetical protein